MRTEISDSQKSTRFVYSSVIGNLGFAVAYRQKFQRYSQMEERSDQNVRTTLIIRFTVLKKSLTKFVFSLLCNVRF
jgi:hypothetical protein